MHARLVLVLVIAGGVVTGRATAGTLIDMPAPKAGGVTFLTENGQPQLGSVALNRYSHRRVAPLYSYMSPPMGWSHGGWRVGIYPYGYRSGWRWGYGGSRGWPWGWRGGWGYGYRFSIGSRSLRGFGFRGVSSSW